MKRAYLVLMFTVIIVFAGTGTSIAAGDLTAQTPIEVRIQLGDKENSLRFFPDKIELETGKLYRVVLHNPSAMAHYFSSEGLSRAVFTRKVQVLGPDGKTITEVKGTILEIEVFPGGTAEWWFVPVKTVALNDLKCTIKGHSEGGMTGTVTIK
ncbi:MAG: biphenyl 2,3-dioxygenase [Nitrospirae bacterium]|nr:MAG: biphenyl 2,3-dioxygenase [Nitrospirota bacterium]